MAKIERLYSGVFECRECEARYEVDDATDGDLFCEDCGEDLVEVEPETVSVESDLDAA